MGWPGFFRRKQRFAFGVLEPVNLGFRELPADEIEPTVAVHVPKVVPVVLHVVCPERQHFPDLALFPIRVGVPMFAGNDVQIAILIDVANRDSFNVVFVQLLHPELERIRSRWRWRSLGFFDRVRLLVGNDNANGS